MAVHIETIANEVTQKIDLIIKLLGTDKQRTFCIPTLFVVTQD